MSKFVTEAALIVGLFTVICLAVFNNVNPSPDVTDAVVGSFERELERQPGPAQPVTRDALDDDVLYRTMNSIHWTRHTDDIAPETGSGLTDAAE